MPARLLTALAVLVLAARLLGQTTKPTGDLFVYETADGQRWVYGPEDTRWPVANVPPGAALLMSRPGDPGTPDRRWVLLGVYPAPVWNPSPSPVTPPATQPATAPAPPPTPPPPTTPAEVFVEAGESWVTGVLSAKAGQTVRLAGGDYRESWPGSDKRPAPGVRVVGAGLDADRRPTTRILSTLPDHVAAWRWDDVHFEAVHFAGGGPVPNGQGVRLNGCRDVSFTDCWSTGFYMGVVMEVANGRRTTAARFVRGNYSDNWHPQRRHSHGFYIDRADGVEIRGATIARNGHNPAKGAAATEQNHGGYVTGDSGPIVFVGNVVEDNSSHGWQARSGGRVEDNTFRRHPIHLSFGLVNGAGPIREGGVSGTIVRNRFEGSRLLDGKPRGYCIEVSNVGPDGVRIADNWAYDDAPLDLARQQNVTVCWLKLDRTSLSATNPDRGKELGVKALTVEGNAVTWPTTVDSNVWMHPDIRREAELPAGGSRVTVQPVWPAAAD